MSERVPGRGSVVRVLVAEDMRILRETLVALLSLEEDIEVVAQWRTAPPSSLPRSSTVPTWRSSTSGCPVGTACAPLLSWRGYCRDPRSSC